MAPLTHMEDTMTQDRNKDGEFKKGHDVDNRPKKETNANDVRTKSEGAGGGKLNTDTANADKE